MEEAPPSSLQPLTPEAIRALAATEGLTVLAVIPPPPPLDPAGLDQMLADGVGQLAYMEANHDLRLRPDGMLPGAAALWCVAWSYQPELGCGTLKRARYAAGKDYHVILRAKLGRLGQRLGGRQRAFVDSAPANERTLAHLVGLGWIGRNALIISPTAGSYRVLGFLLTSIPCATIHGGEEAHRCGSCTRCEVACPTKALVGGRVLTERCISYLTIEYFGVIPRDLAASFDGWWMGCDRCQEVCPWNRFAPEAADPRLTGREEDETLLRITAEDFDLHFAGRAVRRLGYVRFRRNLLVALFSRGNHALAATFRDDALVADQYRELYGDQPPPTSVTTSI